MIYCMSDLHGERDLFERMLEQIGFSEEDHLYICLLYTSARCF